MKKNSQKRMYVLVRRDLDAVYRMVQGSHALARFALSHPTEFKQWNNQTIVFLGIRNWMSINDMMRKLNKKKLPHSLFFEPDLLDQATAIACYCDEKVFKDLSRITV